MIQIATRVPEVIARELDVAAIHFNNNRPEVLRQAISHFLEEFEDVSISLKRLWECLVYPLGHLSSPVIVTKLFAVRHFLSRSWRA